MRIISASLLALSVCTQAADADWKAHGFVAHADGDLVCFYDAQSVSFAGPLTRLVLCASQQFKLAKVAIGKSRFLIL
jgi:hypothetical protein